MIFPTPLQHKRIANEKAAILKEIYYDNLRMTGKRIADDSPTSNWAARIKPLQTLALMLALVLFSFSELAPSLYVSARLPLPALSVLSGKTVADQSNGEKSNNAINHDAPAVSRLTRSQYEIPTENFTAPDDPGVKNYQLFLAGDDKVRLSSVFGLGIKTIVIDPGHGGKDPGAIGAMGTMEKDITLDVALKLKALLVGLGRYHVLLTRENDRTLSLADRVQFAEDNQADIFISIHVNSLPNKKINMIETYYFGAPMNSETLRLAEKENKESHFSVGELDAIIQDLGNTLKRQESKKLATAIQSKLFRNIRYQNAQVRNYGIKMAPFVVLSQIEVPSVLVEISCITNITEEKKLTSPHYRAKVASYMEEGIVAYLENQDSQLLIGEK